MGVIATALRYKKTQRYLENAFISLLLAQKTLRNESKDPFKKNIDALAFELVALSQYVASRNRLDSRLASIMNTISSSLSSIKSREADDRKNLELIDSLTKTTADLKDQISKYSSSKAFKSRVNQPVVKNKSLIEKKLLPEKSVKSIDP